MAIAAGALLGAFAAGWYVQGERGDAALATLQSEHSTALAAAEHNARVAQEALNDERDQWNIERGRVADEALEKVRLANVETNRLRDCIADGTCGLRVAAKCPASRPADVPQAGTPGRVDHGAAPELDADARRNYFALREGIALITRQLEACQQSQR